MWECKFTSTTLNNHTSFLLSPSPWNAKCRYVYGPRNTEEIGRVLVCHLRRPFYSMLLHQLPDLLHPVIVISRYAN